MNDADGDGVCDELEIFGCTDAAACNFNAAATEDASEYAEFTTIATNCVNDSDGAAFVNSKLSAVKMKWPATTTPSDRCWNVDYAEVNYDVRAAASTMTTAMACATSWKWGGARMPWRATSIQRPQTTMDLASP